VINGLGAVQSVLVVGGASEIGLATVRRLASKGRLQRVVLAGRPSDRLEEAHRQLAAELRGAAVETASMDLTRIGGIADIVDGLWQGGIDVVVLAAGVLPDPDEAARDPRVAVHAANVNYVGQLEAGTAALAAMQRQGHGSLVVISSVAAERPRKDNFVYGSSKVGLDAWATGAADALSGSPIRVVVVRPGMVRTRMSAGMPEAPMTCDADDVAKVAAKAAVRGPTTVWVPGKLRYVMSVLRHLPRPIFRRLSPGGKPDTGR
jgi:decaprenylphospho-beta-D-erythro-pentofuranosid-2-ulose 2-reductase